MSGPGECSRVNCIPQSVKVENAISSAECLKSNPTNMVFPKVQMVDEKWSEVQKIDESTVRDNTTLPFDPKKK